MEATDGPLLASVPAPCSQMERWLLASPSPEEPETSLLPTLFQGEGKLEPQTLIHWSDPNLPIWGEHSRGPRSPPVWPCPPACIPFTEEAARFVLPEERISSELLWRSRPPPTLEQNHVSDKGFEVNKVLKACPVVCACWSFPLQLVWLWGLVGHRRFGNAKRQRCLSASADWGSQCILPPQKLSHYRQWVPAPAWPLKGLFPCPHHHQSVLATLPPW